ncbi:MAG: transporter [Clostridia bacterium]|nr:MAG: transporter [Clostridia bacterium]
MALFLAFVGMLCWGLAPLFGKYGLRGASPMTALSVRTMIAASLVVAWTLGFGDIGQLRRVAASRNLVFIAVEALLATLVGDLAYFAALKHGNINQVTLVLAASPLVTIIAAYFFLGERLTLPQLLGAFLVVTGLFLVGIQAKL